MKTWRGTLIALLAVAAPVAAAAQGFEGVMKNHMVMVMPQGVTALAGADTSSTDRAKVLAAVAAKLDGADPSLVQTMDITFYLKGTRARNETAMSSNPMGPITMIVDAATDSVYAIVNGMQRIMVASGTEMAGLPARVQARAGIDLSGPGATPTLTDLGESTLNGARLRHYRLVSDQSYLELWLEPAQQAVEAPALKMLQRTNGNPSDSISAALLRGKGRQVRSLTIMKAPAAMGSGWFVTRMDMEAPVRQPVADSLFVLPADYARMRLMDMMPQ